MNSCLTSLVLVLATPALAFQPSPASDARPSVALRNTLRDMASYPDDQRMMSDLEAFDRNGAFSRSPPGGMAGRPETMYGAGMGNPNPFARRGGGPSGRVYTRDGFDPYSAYGTSFGPGPRGLDYYAELGMMGGGGRGMGGGGMNGVHDDNTIQGFSYSSRVREMGPAYDPGYDFEMGGGFEEPIWGGGMEEFHGPNGGRGYGGFDGEMDMGLGP